MDLVQEPLLVEEKDVRNLLTSSGMMKEMMSGSVHIRGSVLGAM